MVTSSGIEAEARWLGFGGLLELAANSSWMTAKKTSSDYPGDPTEGRILVYSPRQTATIQITFRLMPVEVSVQNLWTSYRYTTSANDEFLPAHSVTSAAMQTRLPLFGAALRLKLELLNMFDEQYSSIALFPMPGREFRGTCGVEL
jgi:outer membrane receptor protein involved in Fe transport